MAFFTATYPTVCLLPMKLQEGNVFSGVLGGKVGLT